MRKPQNNYGRYSPFGAIFRANKDELKKNGINQALMSAICARYNEKVIEYALENYVVPYYGVGRVFVNKDVYKVSQDGNKGRIDHAHYRKTGVKRIHDNMKNVRRVYGFRFQFHGKLRYYARHHKFRATKKARTALHDRIKGGKEFYSYTAGQRNVQKKTSKQNDQEI